MQTAVTQGFRLSPQQQRLWRAQTSSAPFAVQCRIRIEGEIDRERLRRALERAVERHEILRTTFHLLPGMTLPVQVIGEIDARHPGFHWTTESEAAAPFDLAQGPLLRAALVRREPESHDLLLTLPAIAADAASLRNLAAEVAGDLAGTPVPGEPDGPLQYADAAEILHEWLGPEDGSAAAYWRSRDLTPLVRLAFDQGRRLPSGVPFTPLAVTARLGDEAGSLAAKLGLPLDVVLLAGWMAALQRSTGEEEIVVGTAFHGRTCAEFEGALGPFARLLPVSGRIAPGSTLAGLAADLAAETAEAAEQQDGFAPETIEGVFGEGEEPRWPFGFDCEPAGKTGAWTVETGPALLDRCDLHLSARPDPENPENPEDAGALGLSLRFDPLLYGEEDARRLLDRFVRVLEAAAVQPEGDLAEIDVLSAAERRELLADFNRTAAPFPADRCVHELFAEQALRTPDAPALLSPPGAEPWEVTYAELKDRAGRLARHLRALGVGPESRVGLFLDRSPEVVEGILGVLEAGGAYVPLDTSYPAARLELLLADSGISVLLTGRRKIQAPGSVRVLRLPLAEEPEAAAPISSVDPQNPAYVLYTSGSTGRPKGVVVTHRNAVHYLSWAREAYGSGTGGGAPVHSAIGFDLTVTSLLLPLISGTPVTLLHEEQGVGALAAALRAACGYSLVKLTPAHLEVLRQLLPPEELAGCTRALVVGGEALWSESLAVWRENAPDIRIFNEYGPTEATVGCSVYEAASGEPRRGPVPIGRPIANTRLYVSGPGLQPVPAGVAGELWIGGEGLARGYLGRPDLTAERFVPDPFGETAGERLYRSGDLVRLLPQGDLEYLGRIDAQVKVRGFRIEPGEIEAALASHPEVAEAAVAAWERDGGKQLAGYAVPCAGCRPSAADLRAFLEKMLPEHMVPAAFVLLDALPLTPHGKLDRKALPEPRSSEAVAYAAPRTLEEDLLAEIWGRVLGVARVGIDDHFFTLGGDSIRSIQVLSLAQERGIELTLQELFQHPTIRALAARVRFGGAAAAEVAREPFAMVAPEDRERLPEGLEDAYPLARLQAGMVFHTEYSPGSAIYHDQHSFHLRGAFDRDLLQAALDGVALRHAVLRTSFEHHAFREPLQLVHRRVSVPVAVEDLSGLPPAEQDAAVDAWLAEDRRRGFEWDRAPLARVHIHLRGAGSFQFTFSFHHSVLDGWSAATLLTELFRRYSALLTGTPLAEEPPLTASFGDFVLLERRTIESPESKELWSRMLAGATVSRLPRRPAVEDRRGAAGQARQTHVTIPIEVSEGLRSVARAAAVPLKSVLLAAHLKTVSFLSGQGDVTTGLIANGRPERADGDQVLGLFLNTLPLRMDLSNLGDATWEQLAQAAFELEKEILPHRRYPLADLQAANRGLPLFEIAFNFLHYHVYEGMRQSSAMGGIGVLQGTSYEETNFPLLATFHLETGGAGISLRLNYPEDELTDDQAAHIGSIFLRALADLALHPGRPHREAPLLAPDERRQILEEWGDGGPVEPARPETALLHQAFARQAERTPLATALICGEERLSYAELRARTGRLARLLRSLGVGPEVRVGVCADRTVDLIVALLATLEAGGAYVPLDPAYPRERLAFTLEDARASVLLTQEHLLGALPPCEARIVCLESAGSEEVPTPSGWSTDTTPDNLAYVIYTSGSTGRPKGVAISHRSATALLGWASQVFPPEDTAGVLASTSVCFDLSVFEIFVPLSQGGTVILAANALALPSLPAAAEVTLINTVPSAMAELLRTGDLPASLRVVNLAGEPLPRALVEGVYTGTSAGRVYNLYGPSEDTTYSTFTWIRSGETSVPAIGRPVAGGRAYLLDRDLQPVPAGVTGELFLGGEGLARGYLARPDLTAARFIPDSWSRESGSRLYRTGDLAVFLLNGELEFLGRVDHQVKVRGFRIELGEIEAALTRHPEVREAVVVGAGAESEARLVAYLVPRGAGLPAGLREHLRAWLPEHMVPSAFVALEALPLTPNGKVDRSRLPDPGAIAVGERVAPRTPVEEMLAGIWSDVLGVPEVGAHDDFFGLGGQSLLATRVVSRLRTAFGVEVPLRTLFDRPTVAGLAAAVEEAWKGIAGDAAPPLLAAPHDGDPPLSFAQQRLWFIDQLEPGSPAYNIPAAVRLAGDLDLGALAAALAEVVARHGSLRTTFGVGADGQPVQRIAPAGAWLVPEIDLGALPLSEREAEARRLAISESRRSFDLGRGPLLRNRLLRLGAKDHALLLTMHHSVSDGWSIGILIREVAALYAADIAFSAGRPSPLPPLPIQYSDFSRWQRSWLEGEVLEGQIRYWREKLAGAPTVLELPGDRPRPPVPSGRGDSRTVLVPKGVQAALAALGRREGATLFMTLLAGFDTLLHRYTGRDDLLVGTDVAGRNRSETEGLIGFFVNQLALRADLSGDPPFRTLLARVRETALGAYAHQDLPFERLVEVLQPERDLSRQPVFQIVFVLQNMPAERAELPGLSLSPMPGGGGTARLDLTVVAAESPEGLWVNAEYSTDLFEAPTIGRLLAGFGNLLAAVAADPDRRLSEVPLLGEAERHQLLTEWNDRRTGDPAGIPFHRLFEARAAQDPGAIAAVCRGGVLTYGDLDRRAGNLARHLAAAGMGPESVVPLLADRGLDFLTAMLAVWKAGGAYLPLDPLHPALRLVQLVGASGARVTLASRRYSEGMEQAIESLTPESRPRLFPLEDLIEQAAPAADVSFPAPEPDGLAYVIYTSGSTGTPKGAMVLQGGMLNHLWAKVADLGLTAADVVAQTASQCFDISVWQFLSALLVGGRVEIFPEEVSHDPLVLLEEVERSGVTILETVPSLLRILTGEIEARGAARPRLAALRWMIPTGEALPPDLCRQWLRLYPRVPLLNAYGPTECSDDVTHHPVFAPPAADLAQMPIGRPVGNMRLYVLGAGFEPAPAGVPGELFIGGAGVGRGYLHDGRRTAEAWLPDPFSETPGDRLYRTGDLARWLGGYGTIEFLGRIDHQVKVRGHRIELGEIEAVLAGHPGVRAAAVLAREDTPGNRRLVAYVVPQPDDPAVDAIATVKVEQWEAIFDEVYGQQTTSERDSGINLRVWISSYTGQALPEDEIFECFEDSVARILALSPRRVLEVGCGTGLLLLRIAPHAESYTGTDVSAEVLRSLGRRLEERADLPPVELLHRAADDFTGLPPASFDTVVLNEVVQYFPGADYLVRSLEGMITAAAPGGTVFVGGVRSLPLLEAFHTSIELHQAATAAADTPLAALREQVRLRTLQEKELLVDPALFTELAERSPRVSGVHLQLRGGRAKNELTRFRYDVALRIEGGAAEPVPERTLDWPSEGWTVDGLRRLLAEDRPSVLAVLGIPNARLTRELAALDLVRAGEVATAGELREALGRLPETGVEPADLWDLGAELGYRVEVRWSGDGSNGRMEALFHLPEASGPAVSPQRPQSLPASWSRYTNNPARGILAEGLVPQLRVHVTERLPDFMVPAAFVLLDAMPLTPNGKLDRRALPAPDQARPELDEDFVAPRDTVEETLAGLWAQVLRLDRVGIHDNFFELGGDSILSIQVVSRANQAGLRLTPRQMFQHQTIAELAAVVDTAAASVAEQGPVTGWVPLLPVQRWFFEQRFARPWHWNQSVLLASRERLDPTALAPAAEALFAHHDALRLRFLLEGEEWRQLGIGIDGRAPYSHADLSALPAARRPAAVEAAADQIQGSLDLEHGPIARLVSFDVEDSSRLLFVIHHLAVDGISWRVLLEDLETAYRASALGGQPALPPKTASFKSWAEKLSEHAASGALEPERGYWLAEARAQAEPLPVDTPGGENTVASARSIAVFLSAEETQALLQEVPKAYHTQINDALMTALAQALARWAGGSTVLVDLEGLGREGLTEEADLSRTVGWFTSEYPVLLEVSGDPGEDLKSVKEQLRSIPGRGLGYGLLRYLGDPETAERLAALPPAGLIFNYMGQLDQALPADTLLGPARESAGRLQGLDERRTHLLEVSGRIAGGQLGVSWTYSADLHRRETVEALAHDFIKSLRALIAHCRTPEAGGFTPSDFAAARLNQKDLDKFLAKIGKGAGDIGK